MISDSKPQRGYNPWVEGCCSTVKLGEDTLITKRNGETRLCALLFFDLPAKVGVILLVVGTQTRCCQHYERHHWNLEMQCRRIEDPGVPEVKLNC